MRESRHHRKYISLLRFDPRLCRRRATVSLRSSQSTPVHSAKRNNPGFCLRNSIDDVLELCQDNVSSKIRRRSSEMNGITAPAYDAWSAITGLSRRSRGRHEPLRRNPAMMRIFRGISLILLCQSPKIVITCENDHQEPKAGAVAAGTAYAVAGTGRVSGAVAGAFYPRAECGHPGRGGARDQRAAVQPLADRYGLG